MRIFGDEKGGSRLIKPSKASCMAQKNIASNSLRYFGFRNLNNPFFLFVILACLFIAEWFLFRRFFGKYIARFFLADWDQIGVYSRIYRIHFGLESSGFAYIFSNPQLFLDKQAMKGLFVTFLGVLMTGIFGPFRLTVIGVNFALFLSGQIAVAVTSYRRFGLFASLLAVGLFLLSLTHYILIGGINDMRLDYAAMIMMGWAFIANFRFLENGGRFRFALAGSTLLLNVLTRSILVIYWNVASGFLLVLSLIAPRLQFLRSLDLSVKRVLGVFSLAVSVFVLFLLVFWQPFSKYYIFRVANGEAAMRASAYGCHGYLEVLTYNFMRFVEHFQYMFEASAVVLVGLAFFQSNKKSLLSQRAVKFARRPFFLLLASLFSGCLLSISCFMPSPNHIGVLTIPCALFLTLGIYSLVDPNETGEKANRQKLFLAIASCIIFTSGIGLFAKEMLRPSFPPRADEEMSDLVRRINEVLAREIAPRDVSYVCFPILSEEWHFAHLEVYWYENLRKALPENYGPIIITPFEHYDWKQVNALLDQATFVVLPLREPKCTDEEHTIKGQAIVRKLMPQIKEKLGKDFYPVAVQDNKIGYSIGIFRNRKP